MFLIFKSIRSISPRKALAEAARRAAQFDEELQRQRQRRCGTCGSGTMDTVNSVQFSSEHFSTWPWLLLRSSLVAGCWLLCKACATQEGTAGIASQQSSKPSVVACNYKVIMSVYYHILSQLCNIIYLIAIFNSVCLVLGAIR